MSAYSNMNHQAANTRPLSSKRRLCLALSVTFTVALLGAATVVCGVLLTMTDAGDQFVTLGRLKFYLEKKQLQVMGSNGREQRNLTINVGHTTGRFYSVKELSPYQLEVTFSDDSNNRVNVSKMILTKDQGVGAVHVDVYTIKWQAPNPDWLMLEDRVDLTGAHWYGGSEVYHQHWPLEQCELDMHPYVTNDIFQGQYGGIQERLWFSTNRIGIYVPNDVPLWVEVNSKGSRCLGLRAQYKNSIYSNFNPDKRNVWLEYKLIVGHEVDEPSSMNMRRFNRILVDMFYEMATAIPDERMIIQPIWSTWAKYKKPINQSSVLDFARQIVEHKFNNSQLEIDDEWATHYGDLKFEPNKFPDVLQMTNELRKMGFRTTLWTHPFATTESSIVKDTQNDKYWLKDANGELVNCVWWDSSSSRVMDATSSETADWYVQRLESFRKETGIDSYKFDAGETNWLGASMSYANGTDPNHYSTKYAEMCARLGNMIEVRVGTKAQHLPIFVRLLDRNSKWGLDNGLHSMITAILTAGTIGYAYIMPDMVGGNAYSSMPDRELYVRWVEASVFLPTVQFSIPPWDYDDEVVTISRNMMLLREKHRDDILAALRLAVYTGEPTIRPMWFIEETEEAFTCNSQFLLGDTIMVAPVLKPNVSKWSVYIPKGNWKSQVTHQMHTGPIRIEETVTLATLPYYTKMKTE